MNITIPHPYHDFTIYSKTGCVNCETAADLVRSFNLKYISCDEWLKIDRELFITEISRICKVPRITSFPLIFAKGEYIGGLNSLKVFLEDSIILNEERKISEHIN